ncbi:hypothetical protein DLAC_05292 [Tieghemostelium lacteum]|uniref:Uncharacterized protein n=1 Tax=Tieghemostelium lacteum TaxID=361077 RepID=A0A151ZIR1_TIELA|nr:hypothetical protein DLAC_05292 [Tieghemostelium lacteum]|eukprot:KYQ93888.1 hypothetical protein DLAC_05292 [Tieghemostelium lacteum]
MELENDNENNSNLKKLKVDNGENNISSDSVGLLNKLELIASIKEKEKEFNKIRNEIVSKIELMKSEDTVLEQLYKVKSELIEEYKEYEVILSSIQNDMISIEKSIGNSKSEKSNIQSSIDQLRNNKLDVIKDEINAMRNQLSLPLLQSIENENEKQMSEYLNKRLNDEIKKNQIQQNHNNNTQSLQTSNDATSTTPTSTSTSTTTTLGKRGRVVSIVNCDGDYSLSFSSGDPGNGNGCYDSQFWNNQVNYQIYMIDPVNCLPLYTGSALFQTFENGIFYMTFYTDQQCQTPLEGSYNRTLTSADNGSCIKLEGSVYNSFIFMVNKNPYQFFTVANTNIKLSTNSKPNCGGHTVTYTYYSSGFIFPNNVTIFCDPYYQPTTLACQDNGSCQKSPFTQDCSTCEWVNPCIN